MPVAASPPRGGATPALISSPSTAHRSPTKHQMTPNVANVVLGDLHIKPWYPSFYPEDMVGGKKTEWLYVCQWCFKYTAEIVRFCTHCKACSLRDAVPPGDIVYENGEYTIHRIDGETYKLYTQNLSLFAKLFLETKSVFFDVSTFLYYTLVRSLAPASTPVVAGATRPRPVRQVVGFFSKEKMSWDNNNLACILVFPPFQRKGLGQILIAASYELGRREGRFGGPERPLSTLGRKGYISFWCGEICRFVLACGAKRTVSLADVSRATFVIREDLVLALREMDVLEPRKTASGSAIVDKRKVAIWAERNGVSVEPVVDKKAFFDDDDDDSGEEVEEESMEE